MEEDKKNKFSSVFEGLEITHKKQSEQLEETKRLNYNLKEELHKSKVFNIVMLVIAIVSLAITIAFGIK